MAGTRELGKKIADEVADEERKAEAEEPEVPAAPTEPVPSEEEQAEEEEAETPVEPEPAGEPSGEQSQKAFDRAVTAFKAKLCAIFEVDDLQTSDAPGVIGFLLPGFSEKKPHENFTRCGTCNGWGKVLTGSLDPQYQEQPCPDPRCKGRGFWQKHVPEAPQMPQTLVPLPPAQPNGSNEWGEAPAWMGDPSIATPAP